MFLCCVTRISGIVALYCRMFGGFLADEESLYVFLCVTCLSF